MDVNEKTEKQIAAIREIVKDCSTMFIVCAGKETGFYYLNAGTGDEFNDFDEMLHDALRGNPLLTGYLKSVIAEIEIERAKLN